ncbi:MAG: hypothetical protein WAU88_00395 [Candidatus Zixiibacteriota bacterium]
MRNLHSHAIVGEVVAICFVAFLASPSMAQLPPKVINTGGVCPFGTFVDPSMSVSHCNSIQYDFDACPGNGGDISFRLASGPGTIDTLTGLWKWENIPVGWAGQSISVGVFAYEAGNGRGASVTMTVTILPDDPPQITSGCALSTIFTGQMRNTQMMATPGDCDATLWQVQLLSGNAAAQIGIDGNGMATFSTTIPDLYIVRVIAGDGLASDTCDHTYIVHGGGNCCSGLRGNVNTVGPVDLVDLSLLIQYLTVPYTVLPCYEAANINGVGTVDLADLGRLVSYLVAGTPPLQNCP